MKKSQLKIKTSLLAVLFLITGVLSVYAQQSRYESKTYNFAFQIPKNSVKTADSVEKEINYEETDKTPGGYLQVLIDDEIPAKDLSRGLSSNVNKDALVEGFIETVKKELQNAKVTVIDKKALKIAGFAGYKIVTSMILPDIRLRAATFFIPVPEHNRTYVFNITALESDFDRWYKIAEASVNSFEVLKPKTNIAVLTAARAADRNAMRKESRQNFHFLTQDGF